MKENVPKKRMDQLYDLLASLESACGKAGGGINLNSMQEMSVREFIINVMTPNNIRFVFDDTPPPRKVWAMQKAKKKK